MSLDQADSTFGNEVLRLDETFFGEELGDLEFEGRQLAGHTYLEILVLLF